MKRPIEHDHSDLYESPLGKYVRSLYPDIAFYDEGMASMEYITMYVLQLSEQGVVTITDHTYLHPETREQDTWENDDAIEQIRVINLLFTHLVDGSFTHTVLSDNLYEGMNLCDVTHASLGEREHSTHVRTQ